MLPIAEIIRLSSNLYFSRFKYYLPPLGLIFLTSFAGSFINFWIIDIKQAPPNITILNFLAISLASYILSFLAVIAVILYTDQFLNNKKPSIDFKKNIFSVFWPSLSISLVAGLLTFLGFFLLLIPGIIFTVWYAFPMFIAILEKRSGLKLLKQSRELSRGRFWPVFGRLILPNIFWGVVAYLVLNGLLTILGLIVNQSVLAQDLANLPLSLTILAISSFITAFFSPLYLIVGTIVYKEVKNESGG